MKETNTAVSLCTQDYKSLRVVIMICDSLVNTQAHTDIQHQVLEVLEIKIPDFPGGVKTLL